MFARKILLTIGKSNVEYSVIELVGTGEMVDDKGNAETIEAIRLRFSADSLSDANWEYFEDHWYEPMPMHRWADYKDAHPKYQWWGSGS